MRCFRKSCSFVVTGLAVLWTGSLLNAADLPDIEEYQRRLPITENRVRTFSPNQYDVRGAEDMGVKNYPVLSNEISPWNNKRHSIQPSSTRLNFPIKQYKVHSYTPLQYDVRTPSSNLYFHPNLNNVLEMKTVSKYANARVSDMASYGNKISRHQVAGSKLLSFPEAGEFSGTSRTLTPHDATQHFTLGDINRFTPMRNPSRGGDSIPRISVGSNR